MTVSLEAVRQRREEIERLADQYGARNIRVFGSVARGQAGPASDLDILVRFDPDRSLLDLIGFEQDLAELLGFSVDVVTEGGISPYMKDNILAQAVSL